MFAGLWRLQSEFARFQLNWNSTDTSHGKGPDDGGHVKWMVQRRITRQNIVSEREREREKCFI